MRFRSTAAVKSSVIVFDAKNAPNSLVSASTSSCVSKLWLYVFQSIAFMAGDAMPFSSMYFTMAMRPGMRAGPPRSANETKPSLQGQISRCTV
jgi:hypothetical protein